MKALVVEDDRSVRELLKNILSRMGLEVVEAKCDGEALENLVFTQGIGIVVINVSSKGHDCLRVCELTKEHWPYVRMIVSSDNLEESEEKVFESLGVKAFLQKPYDLAEVRDALSQALNHFNVPNYD